MNATPEAHPEGVLVWWKNGEEAAGKASDDTLVVISRFNDASVADCQFSGVKRSAGQCL